MGTRSEIDDIERPTDHGTEGGEILIGEATHLIQEFWSHFGVDHVAMSILEEQLVKLRSQNLELMEANDRHLFRETTALKRVDELESHLRLSNMDTSDRRVEVHPEGTGRDIAVLEAQLERAEGQADKFAGVIESMAGSRSELEQQVAQLGVQLDASRKAFADLGRAVIGNVVDAPEIGKTWAGWHEFVIVRAGDVLGNLRADTHGVP